MPSPFSLRSLLRAVPVVAVVLAGCDRDSDDPVGPEGIVGSYVLTSIDGASPSPLVRYDHTFRDGSRHRLVILADTVRVLGDTSARRHEVVELRVTRSDGTAAAPTRSEEDLIGSATRRGDTLFVTWRPVAQSGPGPTRADTLVIRSGVLTRNDNIGLICADSAEGCPVPRRVPFAYSRR